MFALTTRYLCEKKGHSFVAKSTTTTAASFSSSTFNNNNNGISNNSEGPSCCSMSPVGTSNNNNNNNSLASIPHPTQLDSLSFRSNDWRKSMCQLYRVIFKLHITRLLPMQREFGDRFVRMEFQRHVEATEKHARIFYQSWYSYVAQLEAGETSREMTPEEIRQLTPEQKEKLRELRSHVAQVRHTDSDFML